MGLTLSDITNEVEQYQAELETAIPCDDVNACCARMAFVISVAVNFILAAVVVFMARGCGSGEVKIVTETVKEIDTITRNVVVNNPVPVRIEKHSIDTIVITDTVNVLEEYFAEKEYNIVYSDSNIELRQDVIVERNGLKTLGTDYTIFKERTILREKYVQESERFSLSLFGGCSTDFTTFDIDAGAIMNFRKHGIGIAYGFSDHRFSCFYSYKIFSR